MDNVYTPSKEDKKRFKDMSVIILTPCKDHECSVQFTKSVVNMVAYSWMHGLKVYQMGVTERMAVHWGRNELARLAQVHKETLTGQRYTHILWLDDDHVFNPDMLLCLARNADLDMVSAVYYGRVGRHLPVIYVKDDNEDKYMHYQMIEVPPKLCQVDAVGFGACLMRMDVLDRVPGPWFRMQEAGEDIYFCVHAKEHGIEIYCDGSYVIGHLGPQEVVTHETYRNFLEANREKYADRIKVPLGGNKWQTQATSKPAN